MAERAAPESAAFDDLYGAQFHKLTVQVYAYLGDLGEAQDVVQEAFCRAWSRWDSVCRYDDPIAWVARVAWNLAISRWRRLRTATGFLRRQRVQHVAGPDPDRVVLVAALATLPPRQRQAVILHHLAGYRVAEVAAALGVPDGTVKTWLHRGRAALAAQLGDETLAGGVR